MNTKKLTICSSLITVALICSKIKLISMPLGGSVTLFSMLIISMTGYLYGIKYGFISSIIYSILKLILGGYIFSPLQAIVDYLFSYSAFGLTGFIKNKNNILQFILLFILSCFIRFIFACTSGMLFFRDYVTEGMNPLIYNILYNGSYIFCEAILSIPVIMIIKKYINKLNI